MNWRCLNQGSSIQATTRMESVRSLDSNLNRVSNCHWTMFLQALTAARSDDAQNGADHVENQWVEERQAHVQLTTHYFRSLGQRLQHHQLPLWCFHSEWLPDAWFSDHFIHKYRFHHDPLLKQSLEHDDCVIPPDQTVSLELLGFHAKLFLLFPQGASGYCWVAKVADNSLLHW